MTTVNSVSVRLLDEGAMIYSNMYIYLSLSFSSTISFELCKEPKDQHMLTSMYGFLCWMGAAGLRGCQHAVINLTTAAREGMA